MIVNEDWISDPQLRSFEAQLATHSPRVSASEKDRILYACAFAAGQNAALRSLRCWRTAAALLSFLLTVAMIPYLYAPSRLPNQSLEKLAPPVPAPASLRPESELVVQNPPVVNLDAWQMPAPDSEWLSGQLAKSTQFDSHLHSLTVSSLTRALLTP